MWTYHYRRDRTPPGVMPIAYVHEAPLPHLTKPNSSSNFLNAKEDMYFSPTLAYDKGVDYQERQGAYRLYYAPRDGDVVMPMPTYHAKGVAVSTTDDSGDDCTKCRCCASVILLFLLVSIIIISSIVVSVILTRKSCDAVQVKSVQTTLPVTPVAVSTSASVEASAMSSLQSSSPETQSSTPDAQSISASTTSSLPSSSATYTTAQVTVTVASLTPGQDCYIPGREERLPDGSDVIIKPFYNGTLSVTLSGRECQMWADHTTHSHEGNGDAPNHFATGETMEEVANYCRIVLIDAELIPWCFTTDPDRRWERCNIASCT